MDGFSYLSPDVPRLFQQVAVQQTLRAPIECSGAGLHSGLPITVRLTPARADHGIVFLRTDRPGPVSDRLIPARFDHVVDTRMCTVIGKHACRVGTIEHLMAALFASGIDNALIEVSGPEIPVLDGSSEPWLFLLDCAGRESQNVARPLIEVLNPVRVEDGDAFAELRPGRHGLDLAMSIDFDAGAIGRQSLSLTLDAPAFRRELARARTFAQKHEIDDLQRAGLARGGSLDNAVVVNGAEVLNPTGLRTPDEFVRHKMLDAVGDLALAGAALQARFIGHKSGHALNNRLLRALFADAANWRHLTPAESLLAA